VADGVGGCGRPELITQTLISGRQKLTSGRQAPYTISMETPIRPRMAAHFATAQRLMHSHPATSSPAETRRIGGLTYTYVGWIPLRAVDVDIYDCTVRSA
jgi:hypothetical protein